ncbi:MAG: DUF3597 domain-containing protein [Kofleriaceae bacterium]|nr:MAG: DUF3597 domain-containing protein [Kofleriaceae bacterium]
MIDLVHRSSSPPYKGTKQPAQGRTGLLSELWCYLFGRGAPAYKTADGSGATAPTAPRCGTPQYRTPPAPAPSDPEPEDSPCDGEPTAEDCACEPPVEGREIHIYPGE